jgi:O-antigen/teichoic acid export membrane protein
MRSRNGTRTNPARINMGNGMDACIVTRSSYDPTRKCISLKHTSPNGNNEDSERHSPHTITVNISVLSSQQNQHIRHKARRSGGEGMHLSTSSDKRHRYAFYQRTMLGLWRSCTTVCAVIITGSAYILILRTQTPETTGSFLFAQWLATIVAGIFGAGMSMLTSQRIANMQSCESPSMVAGIFYFLWQRQWRCIICYCLIYLLLTSILSHFFQTYPFSHFLLASLSILPIALSNVAGTTLRGLWRSDLLIVLHLCAAFLSLLLTLTATLVVGRPLEVFQLAFALANALTLILAIVCIKHLLPLHKALQPGIFLKERIQKSLHHSWPLFFLDVIVWQHGEVLFLFYQCSPAEVGLYLLASMISNSAMQLTPFLMTHILQPWLTQQQLLYIPLNRYNTFIRKSCYMTFLTVPIWIILMFLCPKLVILCLGRNYLHLVYPLRILLIATGFGSIATVGLTHLLTTLPQTSTIPMKHLFLIALLKASLVIPFSIHWGITGTAIASALAQILSASYSIVFCRQTLLKHTCWSGENSTNPASTGY